MPELTLRKIPFTEESDNRLRMMKGRTGLDRNYLCRLGFCLNNGGRSSLRRLSRNFPGRCHGHQGTNGRYRTPFDA
jgi:hypothetical protein